MTNSTFQRDSIAEKSSADFDRLFMLISSKTAAGEPIDLEALTADCPQHREQLEMLLPTLQAIADLGHSVATQSSDSSNSAFRNPGYPLGAAFSGTLGDFRILRELGRGGMGVVYEAEQISLGRKMALKILPFAATLDRTRLTRFQNEARAAATLDHPNIVAVHSVGEERGVHYYAMQLVEGQSLAEVIDQLRIADCGMRNGERMRNVDCGLRNEEALASDQSAIRNPQSAIDTAAALATERSSNTREYFRTIAKLGAQIADALDHAHQSGVIHRDIKPANIMLDSTGKALVTDFGLARIEADQSITVSGDLLGTLRYASPEQALGQGVVDHRTDVYSLGATLYELATLRPAFPGSDRQELLHRIALEEPQLPRRVAPNVPRDLETIILKAIAKAPQVRYASAAELAEDLQRFTEARPIVARRESRTQRAMRWTRRYPIVAGLLACVFALLITLATGSHFSARRQAVLAKERQLLLYVSDMVSVSQAWEDGNLDLMRKLLNRHLPREGDEDLRGFEWRLFQAELERISTGAILRHSDSVSDVAYSTQGKFLATSSSNGTVRIWHALQDDQPTPVASLRNPARALAIAISADESRLAAAGEDGTITVWDIGLRRIADVVRGSGKVVRAVAYSPDGQTLAFGGDDNDVILWDTSSRSRRHTLSRHTSSVTSVAFSPDGNLVASVGEYDHLTVVWDVHTGQPVKTLSDHSHPLYAVAFSPNDGRFLAAGGFNYQATLWDTSTWSMLRRFRHVGHSVKSLCFAPDEVKLITGGTDNTARVWDAMSGELVATFKGHVATVHAVAIDPSGAVIATASGDNTVRLHHLDSIQVLASGETSNWTMPLAYTGDGSSLVVGVGIYGINPGPTHGNVSVMDLSTRDKRRLQGESPAIRAIAAETRGDLVVLGGVDEAALAGRIVVGRLSNWQRASIVESSGPTVYAVALAPDGQHFASGDISGAATIWKTETLKPVHSLAPQSGMALAVAFSDDSKHLAVGHALPAQKEINGVVDPAPSTLGGINIWNVDSGHLEKTIASGEFPTLCLAYSPQGRRLASGGVDGHVILWDMNSGAVDKQLFGHGHYVLAITFSPDGRTLATGSADGSLRLWNTETGSEVAKLPVGVAVSSLAFSPDGQTLAAGCADRRVRIYSASENSFDELQNEEW